ncbi:MAG: EamA family transporter, partial [Erysipelotrichaceae bacterium]|nr:EamA family transporter [Erysipelotrichaceae bacterium]
LLTVGLKTCDPLSASLIASIEPVLNPILVAIFYKEYIGPRTFIGAFIVIVSIAVYNLLSLKKDNV